MGAVAAEPAVVSRVADPEVKLRFLREKWGVMAAHFEPEHVILFGSRINGVPHEYSDIDLIVVSKAFAEIRFIWRASHFWRIVRPHTMMTALCYTPEEFADMRSGIGVVADACREGLWLR